MRNGFRFFVVALLGALVLAVSPSALGDEGSFQLVSPSSGSGCLGFIVETISGTVSGCTARPTGVGLINTEYSAAANGSIVFMADDNTDPSHADQGSIWLVKHDGSSVHLDGSTWDFAPTISYDGSRVVFARLDPATGSSDIYSVNSDGSGLQRVVSGGGTNALAAPSISPDGSTIAYSCGPAPHAASSGPGCGPLLDGSYRQSGLMRVGSGGTDPRLIVIGTEGQVSWSPDGRSLAVAEQVVVDLGNGQFTSGQQLFAYHADGSDLFNDVDPTREITHESDPYGASSPQFSPDGSELLYLKVVDDHGNQGNFSYLIGVDGTNRHQVFLSSSGSPYGAFIPTAAPGAPPPLVDMTHITVPSVVGLDLPTATSELAGHNLTVGTVSYRYSAMIGRGLVASQSPSAGDVAHRTAKQGPPVDLVVSVGPAPCVVPKVKGKSLRAAKRAIAAGHCGVGKIRYAFSRTVKKGRVVATKPGAGKRLPARTKVALTLSKGKKR